jgi:hypothetical protein
LQEDVIMHPRFLHLARRVLHAAVPYGPQNPSGPKSPPSAPPAIPPIIINPHNPFSKHVPEPSIDPVQTPVGPPVMPPARSGFYLARA